MEYYVAARNDEIIQATATWLELEDMLSEVNQKKKDKHFSVAYKIIINLIN